MIIVLGAVFVAVALLGIAAHLVDSTGQFMAVAAALAREHTVRALRLGLQSAFGGNCRLGGTRSALCLGLGPGAAFRSTRFGIGLRRRTTFFAGITRASV